MRPGDLVRPDYPARSPERRVGLVVLVGTGYDGKQVKVLWNRPTWYDPDDGLSVEYPEELEVISEGR